MSNWPVSLPPADQLLKTLKPSHPRLLISGERFAALAKLRQSDARLKAWCDVLHDRGEQLLKQPAMEFAKDQATRFTVSVRFLERVVLLSMMYRIDGNEQFLQQVLADLDAIVAAETWPHNPSIGYDLTTSEVSTAMALAYDWLYDSLGPQRRTAVAQALAQRSVGMALEVYRRPPGKRYWPDRNNNWNQVCNGGVVLAALAIGDVEPQIAAEALRHALGSLPTVMSEFAPDGGCEEGPMYWRYGTLWNCLLLDALDTATGGDFGLGDAPGLDRTGLFFVHSFGPNRQSFNFSDCSPARPTSPQLLWLAGRFNQPALAWFEQRTLGNLGAQPKPATRPQGHRGVPPHMFDLIWSDRVPAWPEHCDLPRDAYFGKCEMVSMRSSWEDPNATFVAFKAGRGVRSHGQADAGTFVLDALGERWAVDLGADSYGLPGYFETWAGSQMRHFSYYRNRPEGHNTLVVNPHVALQQSVASMTRIARHSLNIADPWAIADLSCAYDRQARLVRRGVRLLADRRQVLIQDELGDDLPLDVWWFMHTRATIELSADGRTAELTQRGKRLLVRLLGPPGARFEVKAAIPMPSSPNPPQGSNDKERKLAVHLGVVHSPTLAVWFVPLGDGEAAPAHHPTLTPLDEWK